jgi:hypothetical protein
VRRASFAIDEKWGEILLIVACNVEVDKEYELRMDMLALIEFLLSQESLHSNIVFYSDFILQ